jgi:hypothetical protein
VARCAFSLGALTAAALLAASSPADAQCSSNASSCVQCHETQGLRPILQGELPWHVDHGYGDLCASCHGGDPKASVKELAHVGRRAPLADLVASCGTCHAGNEEALAARYLLVPRPPRAGADAGTAPDRAAADGPPAAGPGPARATTLARALAAASLVLGVLLAWLVARARGHRSSRSWLERVRAVRWSPYAAGAGLGVVVAFAALVPGRTIAVSGAVDKLAAYPGSALFPSSPYYAELVHPEITWQVWMLVGLVGGAFASAWLSGQLRKRWLPDAQWVPRFGGSWKLRLAVAFVGAVLVQVGAGIAGGCTSGLAISGGVALSPAAFVFMAGMFLGGIPTAWLWYRGRASR